jgi:putative tricarboxylic transport membrane protein
MGKYDRISGSFWLLFSLFITYESYRLGLGTVNQPGPGFLFFWTGIVIAILAITVIVKSFKKFSQEEVQDKAFGKSNVRKVVLVLAALFLYAFLMEWLGFFISTLLLFIFLLGVIEKKKWWFAVGVSVIVTVLSYLLFETGLQSQLPKGILEFLKF